MASEFFSLSPVEKSDNNKLEPPQALPARLFGFDSLWRSVFNKTPISLFAVKTLGGLIQGEIAFFRVDGDFPRFLSLEKEGFQVYGRSPDLDEILPEMKETDYSKNVFHSRRHIYERWSRYFEIVEVIDAAFAGYQDLVIMRRR